MNFRFSNLLGAPYRGGSILLHGTELLTPVGNRVSQIDLVQSTSQTLPFENLKQIRTLCVSPNGSLLLSVDEDGRALLINRARRALLHHFSFKEAVRAAKFSPDGRYLAVAVGKVLQVWHTPSFEKSMCPMHLHRNYGGCHSDITCIDWSADSQFIAVGSKDLTARVFSLHPIEGYQPPTLAGHKDGLVGVYFATSKLQQDAALAGKAPPTLYTVSKDGALFSWQCLSQAEAAAKIADGSARGGQQRHKPRQAPGGADSDAGSKPDKAAVGEEEPADPSAFTRPFVGGAWAIGDKHYFMQRGAKLSAADFHAPSGLLVAAFSNGVFDLLQLPDMSHVHTLSISRERITAASFNATGDWIALGCARLGQLLVWEWRSETYVLKQQGHYFDVSAAAFSPDGSLIATGADDCKVKLFQMSSGFCFVTFPDHTAPVTQVRFLPSGHAVLSASLDGTVRAFDLVRYRNFRTLTSPRPVQFGSLAVDPAGEIVAAGTLDTFQIHVWSLKTGRLLDILSGHEGPVSSLSFSPTQPLLASCSWDKTVRTWDVFDGKGTTEALPHNQDVLALAFRPDGRQLASSTLDGQIYFWDPMEGTLQGTIEGRRDIAGGRRTTDRRAASNLSSGACFTSLTYSADGAFLVAGGASKHVVVYDVGERVMLRRFHITRNRSLDGVLDVLNSKHMTDAGPLQLIDHDEADSDDELLPVSMDAAGVHDVPGTKRRRPVARSRAVALSPTGRAWAAATTEGLLLYALDEGTAFDPTELTEDLTPAAAHAALAAAAYPRALLVALRLKDAALVRHALLSTPASYIVATAAAVPAPFAAPLLAAVADLLESSPHVQFLLQWVRALCTRHGPALATHGGAGGALGAGSGHLPVLRAVQKALGRVQRDVGSACEANLYALEFLTRSAVAAPEIADAE